MVLLILQRSGFYSNTSGTYRRAELDINLTEIKPYTRCGGLFDSAYFCGSYLCTTKRYTFFAIVQNHLRLFFGLYVERYGIVCSY